MAGSTVKNNQHLWMQIQYLLRKKQTKKPLHSILPQPQLLTESHVHHSEIDGNSNGIDCLNTRLLHTNYINIKSPFQPQLIAANSSSYASTSHSFLFHTEPFHIKNLFYQTHPSNSTKPLLVFFWRIATNVQVESSGAYLPASSGSHSVCVYIYKA
jgi:hypothetical protein